MSVAEKELLSLHGRRLHRLEAIATQLTGLYQDLGATRTQYHEAKAATYIRLMETANVTHGERQSRASLENVSLESEVRSLEVQIQQLIEERDLLKFFVEWDVGA